MYVKDRFFMIFQYSSSQFGDLLSKIKDLITNIRNSSFTINNNDTHAVLLRNLDLIVTLNDIDGLKQLDNAGLEVHQFRDKVLPIHISNKLVDFINGVYDTDDIIEVLNIVFFVDFYEFYLSEGSRYPNEIDEFIGNIIATYSVFSESNFRVMTHILAVVPNIVLKKIINNENLKKFQQLETIQGSVTNSLNQAENLSKKAEELNQNLLNYKHEFNFVGLSKGFSNIREQKSKELFRQNIFYYLIMLVILVFLGIKLYWLINNYQTLELISFIGLSVASVIILFVLLYFFRISLFNIRGLKSQLLQIDLRLSLCEFISSYTDETAKMRGNAKESFDKFESVIFSPIVATDDKIPTTFEGLDQLNGLIGLIKKDK